MSYIPIGKHGGVVILPLDIAWRRTLERLYKVFKWVILVVVFFGLLAPISMFYRLTGRDPLNLELHDAQKSYWIERSQIKLTLKGFYTQFIKK